MQFDCYPGAITCREKVTEAGINFDDFQRLCLFLGYTDAQMYTLLMSTDVEAVQMFYYHAQNLEAYFNQ